MLWQERVDALQNIIDAQIRVIENQGTKSSEERRETTANTLRCLRAFTNRMFSFFHQGFNDENASYQLKNSANEPAEFAYGRIIEQCLFDLEALMDAHRQRKTSYKQIGLKKEITNALDIADQLAYDALTPAIRAGFINPATVLTYYQKSLRISLMPYARVALIGIPFSAIYFPHDYLAIPHEVGHYVYRNSLLCAKGTSFLQSLQEKNKSAWWFHWLEEVFADVYGCVIGGPPIALDFQYRAMQVPGEWFSTSHDYDSHPTPHLRPYIYIETLKVLAEKWSKSLDISSTVDLLSGHWENHMQSRFQMNESNNIKNDIMVQDTKRTVFEAIEEIREHAIRPILAFADDKMKGLDSIDNPFGMWGGPTAWNQSLYKVDAILYSKFIPSEISTNDADSKPPELSLQKNGTISLSPVTNGYQSAALKVGETGENAFENSIKSIINSQGSGKKHIEVETWRKILSFGGWTTEGPDNQPVKK